MDKFLDLGLPVVDGMEENTAVTDHSRSIGTQKIHIHLVQNGRKRITILSDLDEDLDLKRIARHMAKKFNCAAAVTKNDDEKDIIKISGDQRQAVRDWLVEHEVISEKEGRERVVIHGP